jgi:CDP-glucose 4,6-dehydratase
MNIEFWRNKTVLITGHTGFKGSWLSLWLQSMGANLTGYSLSPPTSPSLFVEANVGENMNSIIGNILDLPNLQNVINRTNPSVVIHMAAQPLVIYSYKNPVETYLTNVIGTVNLLESVRNSTGVKVIINVTTDKCYENREWDWGYRENESLGGYDPYSSSKGCSELVTSSYRNSFFNATSYSSHGTAVATARAGNVIGGGDWTKDRLIPDILYSFENSQTLKIRNPEAIRPWQHVFEPLRGYLTLAERLFENGSDYAEAWNFGPMDEDARSVRWIVEQMKRLWGNGAQWKEDIKTSHHEASYLKLDNSKARNRLGWRPKLELSKSLEIIIDWNKRRSEGENIKELCLNQLRSYEKLSI